MAGRPSPVPDRFASPRLAATAALLLLCAPAPSARAAPQQASLVPRAQSIVLNEVLFDELGTDATSGGELVELWAPSTVGDLGDYSLRLLGSGTELSLPAEAVPPATYVVVYLGDRVPFGMNADFAAAGAEGHVVVAAGLPPGDHLATSSDGVQLLRSGQVVDEVSWGTSGPPAGAALATFVDVSGAGALVRPGESIGRDARSTDSDSAADWTRHGGRDAVGPTVGLQNADLLPDADALQAWVQAGLNQLATGLSFETLQPDWLAVLYAQVSDLRTTQDADSIEVEATHTLTIAVYGSPEVFSGCLTARFDRETAPGPLRYSVHVDGTLSTGDGVHALDLQHDETFSGFDTDTRTVDYAGAYTWYEGGTPYAYSLCGTARHTQLDESAFVFDDYRTSSDWGGAGTKVSQTTTGITELQDGVFATQCVLVRPREMGAPPVAEAGSQEVTATQTVSIDAVHALQAAGTTSTYSRYDVVEDGIPLLALQPGALGAYAETIASDDATGIVSIGSSLSLPLYQVDLGSDIPFSVAFSGTGSESGGKLLVQGSYSVLASGTQLVSKSFAVDPPVAGGGGRSLGGFFGAVASCGAAGASVGAGAGAIAGTVAGGVIGGSASASATLGLGAPVGAAAGAKAGLEVGAVAGGAIGGLGGAIGCGLAYFTPWWKR